MVNVRKKKNIQTPRCRPSGGLFDLQLNSRKGRGSVASLKTLSNSSREGRKSQGVLSQGASHNGTDLPEHSVSCETFVFVLSQNGKPLMPTKSGKARRMLKAGIAKVVSRTPFVIKMLVATCQYKQSVSLGVDSGSKTIGVAATANSKTLYASEGTTRTDIKRKMEQRAMYRRTRRGRKTRYRQARFLNRVRCDKCLTPTVRSKVQAHTREISFVKSILPVTRLVIETASFDIHKITNPNVTRWTYQKGRQKDFYNVKAYVLSRDSHTCQKCFGIEGDKKLHVHHITFRSQGGTDSPDNLITLCETCHSALHAHASPEKESLKLTKKTKANTTDATQVSTISSRLKSLYPEMIETFGYETKFNRQAQGLPKTHYNDATVISSLGEIVEPAKTILIKRCVSQGDYQQTSGQRSEKRIPTGKLFGFRKFDLIQTSEGVGFIKGKRSTGYFVISDAFGKVISDSVNIKKSAKRLAARKTVLTTQLEERSHPALKDWVSARENG